MQALSFTTTTVISPAIFRAYDIRGIVDEALTLDAVYTLGLAIGSEAQAMGEQRIIMGRDGRLSGPTLAAALSQGLRDSGCDVVDIGQVPTPVLYFATYLLPIRSGVMLTGSHNPANYNGLKIVLGGKTLTTDAIQGLHERIKKQQFQRGHGKLESYDIIPHYIKDVTDKVKLQRPLRVVIDCGNGVAGQLAPALLRALGCEVNELFCEVDGRFPNHHPDPTIPENLQDLIAQVKNSQADIGLALDGDGDRLGVVTNKSEIIWPDRQLMLYATDILKRHVGATIIYDVKSTRHLDALIKQYGGQPLMWKTGHSLMKAKLFETGALLAGEMSGHIFFKERWYGFDDGLYTAARLLEILAREKQDASAIFAALPDSINTPELKLYLADDQKFRFMEKLAANADFAEGVITDIDGLRVDFADGWGLIRPSNTTPCLVLRFEADTEASLVRIQAIFRKQILALDANLTLPF